MKTTEENNRLIAEFMSGQKVTTHHNQYHVSWNELMPVVEKINTLFGGEMNTLIMSNACKIYSDNPPIYNSIVEANSKIESTYQAVVQFIEWYKEQKK